MIHRNPSIANPRPASVQELRTMLVDNESFTVCYTKANGLDAVRVGSMDMDEYLTGEGEPNNDPNIQVYVDKTRADEGDKRPVRSFKWTACRWIKVGNYFYNPVIGDAGE